MSFESHGTGETHSVEVNEILPVYPQEQTEEMLEAALPETMNGGFEHEPEEIVVSEEEFKKIMAGWGIDPSQLMGEEDHIA